MNQELVQILDSALELSLWVFLGSLFLFLLLSRSRLVKHAVKTKGSTQAQKLNPAYDQSRVVFRATSVSLLLSLLVFAVYLFSPLPGTSNLVTSRSWQITPLRVTAITWDRLYEGFSLEGEVWNQTSRDMEGVTAVISVTGTYDELLDSLVIPVKPETIGAGESSVFKVSYKKNSPFISGYRIGFTDNNGDPVRHITGFDE
jgi:hypothetical protein